MTSAVDVPAVVKPKTAECGYLSPARRGAMIWGGHEPRVYAAVCFWLCRRSGGHQFCCASLSISAAAGSLLCFYWRLTCPAFLTLLTETQQVQNMFVCVMLRSYVKSVIAARESLKPCSVAAMWVRLSDTIRLHSKSRSKEREGCEWHESYLD